MDFLNALLAGLVPVLLDIGAAIAAIVAAFIAKKVNDWLRGAITEQQRTRLHQAIENGLMVALRQGLTGAAADAAAASYAQTYVPDAVKGLKATDAALRVLSRAKGIDR